MLNPHLQEAIMIPSKMAGVIKGVIEGDISLAGKSKNFVLNMIMHPPGLSILTKNGPLASMRKVEGKAAFKALMFTFDKAGIDYYDTCYNFAQIINKFLGLTYVMVYTFIDCVDGDGNLCANEEYSEKSELLYKQRLLRKMNVLNKDHGKKFNSDDPMRYDDEDDDIDPIDPIDFVKYHKNEIKNVDSSEIVLDLTDSNRTKWISNIINNTKNVNINNVEQQNPKDTSVPADTSTPDDMTYLEYIDSLGRNNYH